MRRNWLTVLLFALALTVQAFAPAAAQVASRLGAATPSANFALPTSPRATDRRRQATQRATATSVCFVKTIAMASRRWPRASFISARRPSNGQRLIGRWRTAPCRPACRIFPDRRERLPPTPDPSHAAAPLCALARTPGARSIGRSLRTTPRQSGGSGVSPCFVNVARAAGKASSPARRWNLSSSGNARSRVMRPAWRRSPPSCRRLCGVEMTSASFASSTSNAARDSRGL